jgi:hypothetical protein
MFATEGADDAGTLVRIARPSSISHATSSPGAIPSARRTASGTVVCALAVILPTIMAPR